MKEKRERVINLKNEYSIMHVINYTSASTVLDFPVLQPFPLLTLCEVNLENKFAPE